MQKEPSRATWIAATVSVAVSLILFWLACSLFGITREVCNYPGDADYEHCPTHNLALVGIWEIGKLLNWVGPALTAVATVAIAGFTLSLRDSTEKLWEAGESQLSVLRKSVAANFRSARAAQKQANIAEKALVDLERPYLFLADIALDKYDFSVSPRFHNFGRTPTNIAECAVFVRWLDHTPTEADEKPPENITVEKGGEEVEIIIGQGQTWNMPFLKNWDTLTRATLMLRDAGKIHIYCWGHVLYRDIFLKTHPTYFCRRYNPKTGGWDKNYGK